MAKQMKRKTIKPYEEAVRALFHLSHVPDNTPFDEVVSLITNAPDPETAHQAVSSRIQAESDVLAQKWHDTIISAWSHCHPQVPLLPNLPLTEEDVRSVPVLRDMQEFLREIERESAAMVEEKDELVLKPEEAMRLALCLPSWKGVPEMVVEHEWSLLPVRRLRELAQTLGLVRIVQGYLTPVRSRIRLFNKFPLPQQFYALWHADVYHVNWGMFAPAWSRHLDLVQGYLPLIWDLHSDIEAGVEEDIQGWLENMMDTFLTLWEQEGLITPTRTTNIMRLYRQLAVPAVMKKIVFQDIFVRYRLVEEQVDPLSALISTNPEVTSYIWTPIGELLIQAEAGSDLPCGIELLKR